MGKWDPRLDTRVAYPIFYIAYFQITRVNYVEETSNLCKGF